MTINISEEAIHKISEKIEEFTKEAKDDNEIEFLEFMKNGGPNLCKFLKEEPLNIQEAKSVISIAMVICLLGTELIEEISEKYPEAGVWWKDFTKIEA